MSEIYFLLQIKYYKEVNRLDVPHFTLNCKNVNNLKGNIVEFEFDMRKKFSNSYISLQKVIVLKIKIKSQKYI